jgi:O-antigen ligase
VFVAAAGLTPWLAWLGPLGFAPLVALVGLLCLPAARLGERDRPVALILLALLAWAALSSLWSPFHPTKPANSVALKLALQLVLYGAAWQGAQSASRRTARWALQTLAWGLAGLGVLLAAEAATNGAIYLALRDLIHSPIRPDLGRKNLAQATFVLALLWPVAAAAGRRAGAPVWLAPIMAAGAGAAAYRFFADAPVLSIGLALLTGGLVWSSPRRGPQMLGVGAAGFILLMPLAVLATRNDNLAARLPLSYAERVGYWDYAVDRIGDHPLRGWGLDASRTFSPHIQLHPHDGALQVWLELGVLGAVLAALFWIAAFRRLSGDRRDLLAAGTAGSMATYLLFGAVSFGVWQEWWLALGALVACIAALGRPASDG